jgi:hypothetical protein
MTRTLITTGYLFGDPLRIPRPSFTSLPSLVQVPRPCLILSFLRLNTGGLFNLLWNSKTTSRLKFFAWLLIVDHLNTKEMIFLDKGLQNPASTSMDVHNQLLHTNIGKNSKPKSSKDTRTKANDTSASTLCLISLEQ